MIIWKTDVFKGDKRVVLFQEVIEGLDLHTEINTKGSCKCYAVQDNFKSSSQMRVRGV